MKTYKIKSIEVRQDMEYGRFHVRVKPFPADGKLNTEIEKQIESALKEIRGNEIEYDQ